LHASFHFSRFPPHCGGNLVEILIHQTLSGEFGFDKQDKREKLRIAELFITLLFTSLPIRFPVQPPAQKQLSPFQGN
jgi:hypothetical protein